MLKLRTRAGAVITTVVLTMGIAVVGIGTATVALANTACPNQAYNGTMRSAQGNYLDDYGGGSRTYVHTYQFTGSANQTWCIENASGPDGGFFIHPGNDLGLCLDGASNTADNPIWVFTCNTTSDQLWCWVPTGGYLVRYDKRNLAAKDVGRYGIVQLSNGGASRWYSNGATFPDNC